MPLNDAREVMWNGAVVGLVHDIRGENWNFYGKWTPCESQECKAFLEHLKKGDELVIQVGDGMKGTIDDPPEDEIEWRLS